MEIIVGTAGHIDHGKTALVRALTGMDADRLPEEKRRGISIDIGFAEFTLGELKIAFVDVPGHERFIKNMLAGASGIDLVLLVIAADEGVMPQTREHFEICRLLGLRRGIIVLTKKDLVDEEMLELARQDAAELVAGSFLQEAPVIAFSSVKREGTEELKEALIEQCSKLVSRNEDAAALLPIDRSFSVKGFGAVATGTLSSGKLSDTDELELLPVGKKVRIRGLQTHGRTVSSIKAGQRAAVNLAGIDHSEIERGMILCQPGVLRPTQIIDAEIEVLASAKKPLRSRQRVRLHIGTAEILAHVVVICENSEIEPGNSGFVQFRLESPTMCVSGQHFILRSYSPPNTIAGGVVMVPLAAKHRRRDLAQAAGFASAIKGANGDLASLISVFAGASGTLGITANYIQEQTGCLPAKLSEAFAGLIQKGEIIRAGERYIASREFEGLKQRFIEAVSAYHLREPLAEGIPRGMLRDAVSRFLPNEIFASVIAALESKGAVISDREIIRLSAHRAQVSPAEKSVLEKLKMIYTSAGFEPPKLDEAVSLAAAVGKLPAGDALKIFRLLVKSSEVVKVTDDFYFSAAAIAKLVARLREYADQSPDRVIDVPRFKEIAGVSRKYAIPLLEYLDRERVTVRAGEKRRIL